MFTNNPRHYLGHHNFPFLPELGREHLLRPVLRADSNKGRSVGYQWQGSLPFPTSPPLCDLVRAEELNRDLGEKFIICGKKMTGEESKMISSLVVRITQ